MTKFKRILLVDDNSQLTDFLYKEFTKVGIECEICHNGFEAFDRYKQKKFDLILSDIEMPLGTGIDLLENVRKQNQKIPFVLMSGGNFSRENILSMSVQGFFPKPFIFSSVIEKVRDLLQDEDIE